MGKTIIEENGKTADMLQGIIESMDDGIMIEDGGGLVIFVNRAMAGMLGYQKVAEVCGRPWIEFYSLEQEKPVDGSSGAFESLLLTSTGGKVPILITSTSFYFEGEYIGVLSVIKDITKQKQSEEMLEKYRNHLEELVKERTVKLEHTAELLKKEIEEHKKAQEKIKYLAHYDNLTDLPNRHLFFDRMQSELFEAKRTGKYVALLYIDLDGFKAVNDEYGHDTGDSVLKEISKRITSCLGGEDLASRFGGDEFTVILPRLDGNEYAESIAGEIIKAVSRPIEIGRKQCYIGASIGISMYPENGKKTSVLLRNSDAAMYEVKHNGKNNYLFYRNNQQKRYAAGE